MNLSERVRNLPIPDEKSRISFGCTYVLLAITPIPFYALIVWIFMRKKVFNKHFCYWIMSLLAMFEICNLIGQFTLGLCVLYFRIPYSQSSVEAALVRTLLPISSAAYDAAIVQSLLLAVNRFFVLIGIKQPRYAYLIPMILNIFYFLFCYSVTVAFNHYTYLAHLFQFATDHDAPLYNMMLTMEKITSPLFSGSTLFIYASITVFLIWHRLTSKTSTVGVSYFKEIKIMLQGIAFYLGTVLVDVNYYFGKVLPDDYVFAGFYACVCIFHAGWFNIIVYLTMNSELRREIRKMIGMEGPSRVTKLTFQSRALFGKF